MSEHNRIVGKETRPMRSKHGASSVPLPFRHEAVWIRDVHGVNVLCQPSEILASLAGSAEKLTLAHVALCRRLFDRMYLVRTWSRKR